MSRYIEIQEQSPADGTGFVAQWYADGERYGQAFPLFNTGELLFFAYFTEAPMIVADDATRTMLRERGYEVFGAASYYRSSRRRLSLSRRLLLCSPPRQLHVRIRAKPCFSDSRMGFRASPLRHCTATPRPCRVHHGALRTHYRCSDMHIAFLPL